MKQQNPVEMYRFLLLYVVFCYVNHGSLWTQFADCELRKLSKGGNPFMKQRNPVEYVYILFFYVVFVMQTMYIYSFGVIC